MTGLDEIDVVVLAGGLGTRIKGVLGDIPKVLAPINGRPFLDHLLDRLAAEGAGRVLLSLGHLADRVTEHLGLHAAPLPVETVIETEVLGTAGALRLVLPHVTSDPVMVMNGDTWVEFDFSALLDAHRRSRLAATMLCVEVDEVARYGSVELAADGTLARFVEKDPARRGPGLINGGICLLSRDGLDRLARSEGNSFERDFLAKLPQGSLLAHVARGAAFIDIGTPESLAAAGGVLPQRRRIG